MSRSSTESRNSLSESRPDRNKELHSAAQDRSVEKAERLLIERGSFDKGDALRRAAEKGREDEVKSLLDQGVDVDARCPLVYTTALCEAASEGHVAVAQLLIQSGADVEATDYNGRRALHHAALYGHELMVELLVASHSAVDEKDNFGWTPLLLGASKNEAVVRVLLHTGAVNVNAVNRDCRTPLSTAIEYGRDAVAELLLEVEGIDVNSMDDKGRTPLSSATVEGNVAVVQLLLKKEGIDADLRDVNGQTPLSLAAERGNEAIVKLLLARGADANSMDNSGRTPLSLAVLRGSVAVMKLLVDVEGVDCCILCAKHRAGLVEPGHQEEPEPGHQESPEQSPTVHKSRKLVDFLKSLGPRERSGLTLSTVTR